MPAAAGTRRRRAVPRYFLHHAPTGDFPIGHYAPYKTREEAERQAAWSIANGADPDSFLGIFGSNYRPGPKFGWIRDPATLLPDPDFAASPHQDPDQREIVHDAKQLAKLVKQIKSQVVEEHLRAAAEWETKRILAIHKAIAEQSGDEFEATVPGNAYTWCTGGTATAVPAALTAATAKTVVLIVMAASNQASIVEIGVSFDGVTASAVPVLVELISGTAAGAGTPRAALAAMKQLRGWPAQTSQTTAADTYSAEPTAELVAKKWYLTPNGGTEKIQSPLGREPTGVVTAATDAKTWGVRLTAPAAVNAHVYIETEE